ncbi:MULTISPECIES: MFS transporter [Burkholderia]|jgi:MFS family permease|uniref:MFS transporter n=2 Tax=Burkholderia multivorans TaxID=87883 RepID=A0A1B4N3Q8_9BURK|nr:MULTISPECIES: MFS transporter [Burkholderia]AJY15326.1 sugar (and other) transporter family protein [Burkholderia multivorans ATCC BAA-247]AOJ96303.1 MFS transporter [Burkholderia multivorans]AVR18011.1 MFS transporter [Burkholderia multivorans]EEE08621.1 probable 4-methylmuconolactone transporter [Burkholderia multivorans CGD2]EEE16307.1 probable 4-methylmuconolactone transporter [Burkholderia multivorans CGD2M]
MESKTLAAGTAEPERPARSGLFSWYADAQPRERRAFWSCKVGYMLDGMDTQMLSFVIPTLVATWGISLADAGFIGTITLLASAAGGWLAGLLSDRIGRVRTLQLTVLWFAVFTALCGLAQNYHQLVAARALMGFGFGGEWTAGAVLIGEVIRARDRGKAVGLVQSGWAIGWGLCALLYALLFSVLPAELAWRALFLVGLAPALLVVVIRRYVKEPDVYQKEKAAQAREADAPRFTEIFAPKLITTTLRAALLTTGAQGGYYAITTWLPTFLKTERHLTVMGTGGYLAMIILGSWVGYLTSAYLTDRLGRKPNFILFALGSMAIAFAYTSLHLTDTSMLFLGFPLGFFASGIFSGMGAFLTELFPTRVRGSGQGFCYNVGRAIGALFPFLIGALAKHYGLGASIGIFAVAAYGVMIVAALTLPETRGRELDAA